MKQSYEAVIDMMEKHNMTFQQTLDFYRTPQVFKNKEDKKDHVKFLLNNVSNQDPQSAINSLKFCVKELLELI